MTLTAAQRRAMEPRLRDGATLADLAAEWGIPIRILKRHALRHGLLIQARLCRHWTPEEDKILLTMWGAHDLWEIATEMDRTPWAVEKHATREMGFTGGQDRGYHTLAWVEAYTGFHRETLLRAAAALGLILRRGLPPPGTADLQRKRARPYRLEDEDVDALAAWCCEHLGEPTHYRAPPRRQGGRQRPSSRPGRAEIRASASGWKRCVCGSQYWVPAEGRRGPPPRRCARCRLSRRRRLARERGQRRKRRLAEARGYGPADYSSGTTSRHS